MGINTGWASQHIVDKHLREREDNAKLQKLCADHDELMSSLADKMMSGEGGSEEDYKRYLLTESFIHTLTGTNKEKKDARDQLIKLCGLDVKKIETITGPEAYDRVLLSRIFGATNN